MQEQPMSNQKRILVADDDSDLLDQVSSMMRKEGYEVIAAQGQGEAEEALLASIPDLAILDLMMENMDSGFVLCHHIKKLYPSTPVILLTGVTSNTGLDFRPTSDEAKSWSKADSIMDKPVRPEQLKTEVRRRLQA